MTRQRNKDRKGKEKTKGKDKPGKTEQVGLQEAPHLQDPKQKMCKRCQQIHT
jgi:hypothetical protein